MGPAPQWAALVGPGAVPPDEGSAVDRVVVVASTVRRRRSRQGVSRPKVVQFSLTEEEFDEVSAAAARSGLARGAFAADVTLAAARGTQSRAGSPGSLIRRNWSRNAAPAGRRTCAAWPGCWPSRWRPWPVPATASRCGTARCAPPPRTGCCRMRSGRRSRPRSWTGPGSRREGDDLGVRWVAVRHAADHVHLVATLARQDGTRPRIWNDFYRVREACQDAERRFGLRPTAPADRTAARRATRAETEQAARRGWGEPPRVTLRREVCTAAAGAAHGAGVLRPPPPGRGAGAPAAQHHQSG